MIAAIPLVSSALSLLAPSTSTPSTAAATSAPGADFGSVMNKVSSDAMQSIKHAETLATDGLEGKAATRCAVPRANGAELSDDAGALLSHVREHGSRDVEDAEDVYVEAVEGFFYAIAGQHSGLLQLVGLRWLTSLPQ